MGTRTRGFLDYHLPDDVRGEPSLMIPILSASIPECLAVERYWAAHDSSHKPDPADSWIVVDHGGDVGRWWFRGPGPMSIRFGPRVAAIYAAARWRGFLTIPALLQVHRAAFTAIGKAVGATGILFVPCFAEELDEAVEEGKSFEECMRLIEGRWGPMQGDLDEITPAVISDCQHCPPRVWYLEPL